MLFALAVSVLVATMTAPVRYLFAVSLPFLVGPSLWWLARNDDTVMRRLTLTAFGFAVLLVVLFNTVHRMMRNVVELNLRNVRLVGALRRDQAEIQSSNELLADANRRLHYQATHDQLTGLLNRRGLLERLEQELVDSASRERALVVLFCDLDRFKVINDSLGHAAGDQLLAIVSSRLSDAFRPPHLLARLGGDEFVIVAAADHGEDPLHVAGRCSEAARAAIGTMVELDQHQLIVSGSLGVAISPLHGTSSRDLLRHADAALHVAKECGRDRCEVFDDGFRLALARRVDDEQRMRRALDDGEFVPWYQPIVDAGTGRLVGAELLVRWFNGAADPRPAAAFIELAAESGLVERLSEQVIEIGLRDLARWEASGLSDGFRLSVNLPPRYMSRTGRVHRITSMLTAGPTHRLTVEVTESSVVDDLCFAARQLAELRSLGMTVALDDFGTGSASLTLLQRLPLDGVKIDRSFVADLATDERDRSLVKGFISLARDLRLSVTAEGVESHAQQSLLLRLGCSRQQGYLHGQAMDATAFAARLATELLDIRHSA